MGGGRYRTITSARVGACAPFRHSCVGRNPPCTHPDIGGGEHRLGGPSGCCDASDAGGRLGSCLRRNDEWGAGMTGGGAGMARVGGDGGVWRRRWRVGGDGVRVLFFFGVFGGDPRGVPIWSGRSAVFGFVQGCSGLFGVCWGGAREWRRG